MSAFDFNREALTNLKLEDTALIGPRGACSSACQARSER